MSYYLVLQLPEFVEVSAVFLEISMVTRQLRVI